MKKNTALIVLSILLLIPTLQYGQCRIKNIAAEVGVGTNSAEPRFSVMGNEMQSNTNNKALIGVDDGVVGYKFWETDGTANGTVVMDLSLIHI